MEEDIKCVCDYERNKDGVVYCPLHGHRCRDCE